jgi:hypothetical protein
MMARIEALWEDEAGTAHISPGKLEDLSDGGLCIRVNEPIKVGSRLIVRCQRENFSGAVVQCRPQGQNYVLGIQRDRADSPTAK